MPGPKKTNPFAGETPSRGQRVDALGERLSELRTKLGALASDTAAESAARASGHETKHDTKPGKAHDEKSPAKSAAVRSHDTDASDDEKLAQLVFTTMKGDARRLRQFVQSLARLEAAAAKVAIESAPPSGVKKNDEKG